MPMRQVFERYRYAAAVFVFAVAVFATLLVLHQYKSTFLDLKAFACAGRAFAHGADPYRDAAVRPCEVALATNVFAGSSGFDQPTVPVPWPPYAMPLLGLLGALPFGAAAIVWTLFNFGCLAIAADVLRRSLPQLSPVAIAAFVVFAGVPTEAALGQPAGLELLAIVAAGSGVRAGSTVAMALALAVAAIQPYVALPLALALLCASPAARRAVAACGLVLAAGCAVLWRGLTWEYLAAVVPEHARANVLEVTQLSLTSVLAAAGASATFARTSGVVLYVAAIVVGLWAGRRFAAATGQPEALPWIATLVGTLGAPYLHFQQLACALPGALLVVGTAPQRGFARAAAIGLFVPWIGLLLQITYSYAIAPFAAVMAWEPRRPGAISRVVAVAFALFVVDLALGAFFRAHLVNPRAYVGAPLGPNALTDDSWAAFIAVDWSAMGVSSLAARSVSCASALGLIGATIAGAARRPLRSSAADTRTTGPRTRRR